ncbi:MAG: tryptophan 7-halogenase [Planctomycetaceae bacterium]|nr:tryptophan 7-halogenase [Planctomycetaceae bacterium]
MVDPSPNPGATGADIQCDVAIIGGGPGGSTTAGLLRKYGPEFSVHVFERERMPREHVGESQLPPIGRILEELGCWDKIEAANFPIKIGATYRWGKTPELWDFEFLPLHEFKDEPRPAKYAGQRLKTALQVDRAVYDQILLHHAAELGATVHEETPVATIERQGDRITGLVLKDGRRVRARWYIDASGHAGILRRTMGVQVEEPTALQNVAFWDYWENAKWAVEIGVGGTRVQVLSQKHGWIWFIPLGPTRTSIGFVVPREHFKSMGVSPKEAYEQVVRGDERVASLIAGGTPTGNVLTTKDWSFVSDRAYGENWFLVGEAIGFADPILAAGLTLTHTGARELAYTLLALLRRQHNERWLKSNYEELQTQRVRQHIRFADFWYAANGQFTDLAQHCKKIADDAGLNLTSQEAWRWLAQGGFTHDAVGQLGIGGCDLSSVKQVTQRFTGMRANWHLNDVNVLKLNLSGATPKNLPVYENGTIRSVKCYQRGHHQLPLTGTFETIVDLLGKTSDVGTLYRSLQAGVAAAFPPSEVEVALQHHIQALEGMMSEGWLTGSYDPSRPKLALNTPEEGRLIHKNRDGLPDPGTAG